MCILFRFLGLFRAPARIDSSRVSRMYSTLRAALVLASALAMSGCAMSSSSQASGSSGSAPEVSIVQVTDLGPIPTNADILGRDGAYSVMFQGFSVWLYGDTFLARPDAQNRTLISDSWSFTSDLNAQTGLSGFQEQPDPTGAPAMILSETLAEQAFNQAHNLNACQQQPCGARWALWPSSIVVNPADSSALIFYMVVSAQPGNFNFQGVGNSVAVWRNLQQLSQRPTLNPPIVADHPDLLFSQSEPSFGSAAFVSHGTLYAYGCGTPNSGSDKGCRLGKVDPSSAQDRNAWTFYAGNGNWSSQIGSAISVFTGDNILSVSWNNFVQQYVAVYSQVFSQNVMIRTSPIPEGPWSKESTALTAMPPAQGNVYDAHAHPEYDLNGGQTIFVSYSRATAAFSSEVRLVAVQLQAAAK
jgi:Domain of unknown function (DUF4185)